MSQHPACTCSWIDSNHKPTPHLEFMPAIALAVCYDPISFGEKGSEPFPICELHAKVKGKFWKLLPLPEQKEEEWHDLVKEDRYFEIIPDTVSQSIRESFPKQAKEILDSLKKSRDHWYFMRWGMYVGVEYDGYIHT